jgi:membrane fusion protein, multidrug efflux system
VTRRRTTPAASLALLAGLLVAAGPPANQPSAAVQLARLQAGSLPRIVTAYGSVQPSIETQQIVMAPLSAVVRQVFVRQGAQVPAQAPLLRLAPSPAAAESYARAESALRVATELVDRTRGMVGQHLATAQQLAKAENARANARAALTALQQEGADRPRTLRAAFAAIVIKVSVSPGTIVTDGSPLVTLAQPQGLILKTGVVPADAAAIAEGNQVTIQPLGASLPIRGTVLLRGSLVDQQSGLVPIEIALPTGAMLPGEMAAAHIATGRVSGYVVPHVAILVDQRGAAYVVQSVDMVAKRVAVTILCADGDRDVIAGPLDPKAPLVLAGNYQLTDGMRLRPIGANDTAAR